MGEAKRRGTFEERVRQSKLRETVRHEADERGWAEHRQQMMKKAVLGGRQSGRGILVAAAALATSGYSGMIDRAADRTRRAE